MTLPAVPESFAWSTSPCGLVLRCRPFDAIAPHLFTTREAAISSPDDWHRVALAVDAESVATARQVHGRDVVIIRRGEPRGGEIQAADVLVSNDPRTAVAVRAADCVPILLADSRTGAVAAVHAGWRGMAKGAIAAAVDALYREFGVDATNLHAVIGPSIGVCCYEVGSELVDAFAAAGHTRELIARWFQESPPPRGSFPRGSPGANRGSLRLDLAIAGRDQLVLAGVTHEQIHTSGLCTAMHLDVLTSYRAEKDRAGRIAGVIRPRG